MVHGRRLSVCWNELVMGRKVYFLTKLRVHNNNCFWNDAKDEINIICSAEVLQTTRNRSLLQLDNYTYQNSYLE